MPSFKDSNGREWLVKLDAPTIKEVRTALSFDLLADDAYGKLATDDVQLIDCLWVLCRSQAAGLTDVEFGKLLGTGEAIDAAAEALIQARRDFFPSDEAIAATLPRSMGGKGQAGEEDGPSVFVWPECIWTITCYQLAGFCGVRANGLTASELWLMATGKRLEERRRVYELSAMVWALTGESVTESDIGEFLRCGCFADPATKKLPFMPEVEARVAEFEATGKLILG